MATSTNLISGLSSGFDWRSMIDQLIAAEHGRVDLVANKKADAEKKLTEWQSFNGKLLAMKNAASNLKSAEAFGVFKASMSSSGTVSASDLLAVTTSATASAGSYTLKVNNLAAAQKLSSASFASASEALGADYVGDLLINGKVITVGETDTLTGLKEKINDANSGANPTGVSASIVAYGVNDNRLIITSANTGAQGLGLQNGSAADLVQLFGWKDKTSSLRNSVTGGAQSDAFSTSTQNIKSFLGLSTTQSGTIQIKDGNGIFQSVVGLNLSTDSLEDINTAINDAGITGVTAAVVAETTGVTTSYKLQINGSQDFVDAQNILATLGVLQNGVSVVKGTTSGNAMTVSGQSITSSTLLTGIDGYNKYTLGDKISLGATSRDHSNVDVSGDILTITETTTVSDLLGAIKTVYEANGDEVSVYLTSDGKIQVADQETGASGLIVDLQSTIADTYSSLSWGAFTTPLAEVRQRQLVAGADASVTVDGVTVTSAENTIDDILIGVSIDLLKADDNTTVTLNIGRDLDAIMAKINAFVTSYNNVYSYINTQSAYDPTNQKTGGILFGDGTLASVKSDMTSILVQTVWGVSSEYSTLGLVGVNVDSAGKLSVDSSKLRGYLTTNFNDVQKLFTATGVASTESLTYASHGINTKAGAYTVHIGMAATKSTSTPSTYTSLGVGATEMLTITSGSNIAKINLTGGTTGMTMTEIVNAVNSGLAAVSQVLGGAESLYADAGQVAEITGATKWSSVYDDIGVSAGLAENDVISFSGKLRTGAAVSGSYTISDIANDTVQGLLTAIETAFGYQVTASINESGQIAITDKTTGGSSIALTFDYAQAHALDFGAVSTTNPSGQMGHSAMGITASADLTDHLVITHDGYGSVNTFTVQQQNKLLWDGVDFPTVNQGLDVTGTINGEAATGVGQILTGDSGAANVDGLSVKYTGTTDDTDAGTMTLTLGVAELYDRALFHTSDNIDGYVPFKIQSLGNNVSSFQTQADEMEVRLERKREQLINRFVQMELALQKIQSQSNWLAGQLSAADKGWAWNS